VPKFVQLILVCVAAVLIAPASQADEVVGAIWQVKNKAGKEWQFRAGPKGVLWTVPKEGKPEKLGTWTGNGANTVMNIDAPNLGGIGNKRTITIVMTEKKPAKWQGEAEFPDGKKMPLTVTLIKD
jgi:hypothetical protein